MKTAFVVSGLCFAAVSQMALCQTAPAGHATGGGGDWLSQFISAFASTSAPLEQVDPRNRDLFGDRDFLNKFNEEDRFVDPRDYRRSISIASGWMERQFPALESAFSAKTIETAVNIGGNVVFIRGRAADFDFAAVVPFDAVAIHDFNDPVSITLVQRSSDPDGGLGPVLEKLLQEPERERPASLGRALARLGGKVSVETVVDARVESGVTRIVAEGAFRAIGLAGRLELVAIGPVLRVQMRGAHVTEGFERGKASHMAFRSDRERPLLWFEAETITPTRQAER